MTESRPTTLDAPPGGSTSTASPTTRAERIDLIDVLRGVAILGIVVVNAPTFFVPAYLEAVDLHWFDTTVDRGVGAVVTFVAQGKFYPLFSMLFGVGIAIQLGRAEARGQSTALIVRRLSWLLVIGLIHAFLFWFGDILTVYALAGFLLLPLRHLSDRMLLIGGGVLILVPLAFFTFIFGLIGLVQLIPDAGGGITELFEAEAVKMTYTAEVTREIFQTGSFAEIVGARAGEVMLNWQSLPFMIPDIVGLFAWGLVAGRRGWLVHPNVRLIRRALPWLYVAGLAAAGLQVWGDLNGNPVIPSFATWCAQVGLLAGGPILTLAYVGTLTLLFHAPGWQPRMMPFAAVGRMALTNYLTHTLVFTTIALPWGLGLYGQVGPAVAAAIGVGLYGLQILISQFWLARFRFGPFEWLWRSLTYRKLQPFTRSASASA